jgi:hypothetical protein
MIHTVTYHHPQYAGTGRKHQWRCSCGAVSVVTADLDDARRAGAQHVAGHAHAAVAAGAERRRLV